MGSVGKQLKIQRGDFPEDTLCLVAQSQKSVLLLSEVVLILERREWECIVFWGLMSA